MLTRVSNDSRLPILSSRTRRQLSRSRQRLTSRPAITLNLVSMMVQVKITVLTVLKNMKVKPQGVHDMIISKQRRIRTIRIRRRL